MRLTQKDRDGWHAAALRANEAADANLRERQARGEILTADGWMTREEHARRQAALTTELTDLLDQLNLGE